MTSKLTKDEINKLFYGKHPLWLGILNESFEDIIEIKKGQPIGFFAIEPENLKFQRVPCKTWPKKERKSYTPKNKEVDRRLFRSL